MNSHIFSRNPAMVLTFFRLLRSAKSPPFVFIFFSPSRAENDTRKRINLRTTERHNRNHPRTHGAKEIHSFARAAHQF